MKRIGFVSYWFNRGQAVVTRYIKSIFDEAGYETFVLVRRGRLATLDGDWEDKNITVGSLEYDMPAHVYTNWAKENKIDVCFFDQNYQFKEIKAMKELGVKTIGRFVWEQFAREHAGPAKKSFDIIYSLTKAEQKRYAKKMGIDSPLITWGIHPSLLEFSYKKKNDKNTWFYFPAGYCNDRKNINKVMKAFVRNKNPNTRLLVTSQKKIENWKDPRIKYLIGNIESHKDFHRLMAECDVCLVPSKWEGLGLSFVEALAFNMPIITTDFPPMNEYVEHGRNGFLTDCDTSKKLPNGLKIADIKVGSLTRNIELISDKKLIDKMIDEVKRMRSNYDWENTKKDYLGLIQDL